MCTFQPDTASSGNIHINTRNLYTSALRPAGVSPPNPTDDFIIPNSQSFDFDEIIASHLDTLIDK